MATRWKWTIGVRWGFDLACNQACMSMHTMGRSHGTAAPHEAYLAKHIMQAEMAYTRTIQGVK